MNNRDFTSYRGPAFDLPLMNQADAKAFAGKISKVQQAEIDKIMKKQNQSLRIMSFNMLVYFYDDTLEFENQWPQRLPRVAEYVLSAKPDIIGSQELQHDQIEELMNLIGDEYAYYGVGKDGEMEGDIEAILYRKDRISLIKGQGIEVPFFDGAYIQNILTRGPLDNSIHKSALAQVGPLSSTNHSKEKGKSFEDDFTPGVFLDHIFINKKVQVLVHGVDPAKVDQHYPSDHFPVITDVLLGKN